MQKNIRNILFIVLVAMFTLGSFTFEVKADTPSVDINSSGFRLTVCDGPEIPVGIGITVPANYVPCNFKGVMTQLQHLLDVAIVLGVLVAIGGFSYAGYLYMTGIPGNRTHANSIFTNVVVGFIIMLSAWFIVYQILAWLTGNSGYSALLGTP